MIASVGMGLIGLVVVLAALLILALVADDSPPKRDRAGTGRRVSATDGFRPLANDRLSTRMAKRPAKSRSVSPAGWRSYAERGGARTVAGIRPVARSIKPAVDWVTGKKLRD